MTADKPYISIREVEAAHRAKLDDLRAQLDELIANEERIAADLRAELAALKPYEREAAQAAIQTLQRELARVTEQRDSAFQLIEYAGELLGVTPQEHKAAHGFAVLQAIKDLTNKQP